MSLLVTSHFFEKMTTTNPTSIVTVFTFANSDHTSKVVKRGKISRRATDVTGGNLTMSMENASQVYNDFITNKTRLLQSATLEFGFSAVASGSNDVIQLFGGKLKNVSFDKNRATLKFEDKLEGLNERRVGTKETPVSFVNTDVNLADLAWWLATSYGGLSAVESTSNPDINYATWLDWHDNLANDNIVVRAHFTGEKVFEAFDTIQRVGDSVIYAEGDNKLYFTRWTGAGSDTLTFADSDAYAKTTPKVSVSADDITNNVEVLFGWDPTSEAWGGSISFQNTASVNSYGLFERSFDDETVWFVNSQSALNLAQRVVFRRAEPNINVKVVSHLGFLNAQLGDEVQYTSRANSFNALPLNLQGYTIDLEKKSISMEFDEGFVYAGGRLSGFILDDPYWGLLDNPYNPLV